MDPRTPVLEAHRAKLIDAFARDVIALAPASVLDVGCGPGRLLAALAHAGIPALGLDPSARRAAETRAQGLRALRADAEALPLPDAAFDWVVIRHVLHHLADPAVAVREAWRVARTGIVLAEPAIDPTSASQRAMARLDAFTNELFARGGHVHHPYLDADALLALVPGRCTSPATRAYHEATRVPESEVHALVREDALGLELTVADEARRDEHARAAARGEITYNGSVALFARRTR